jgi:hypothetical protein
MSDFRNGPGAALVVPVFSERPTAVFDSGAYVSQNGKATPRGAAVGAFALAI